jgi:hypothetical protein
MRDMPRNKLTEISVARLPRRQGLLKLAHSVLNAGNYEKSLKPKGMNSKILGKLCPSCGVAGSVFCETRTRIIYECRNGHQYETKKRLDETSAS